jgi:hypothetical protein
MWRAAALAFLLFGPHSTDLFAQTSTNTSRLSGHRYLFVVETSRAMRARARGVFNELKQALDSGLNGQIGQGDTVGIWTFNENVYQGLFPSQKWSQATQLAFAVRLPALMEEETYQKRARLEKLLPEMLQAISGAEAITVVLVSSGEGTMRGTPFDQQINAAWKEWHDEQEGVHMPLVTVLRARLDEITDWSLTPAPRPIELSPIANEIKPTHEKTNDLAKDTPKTEQAEKRAQSTKWGPEQQVAFSVWALGRTGTVATVSAPTNETRSPSHVNPETSKPAVAPSPAAPSPAVMAENQVSNLTVTFVTPQEPAGKLAGKAAEPPAEHNVENRKEPPLPDQSPAQPAQSPLADAAWSVPAQPSPISEASFGGMVAHARTAQPAKPEKIAPGPALAAPPRGFLRENINPLVLLILAAFGAGYCFRNWLLTEGRPIGTTMSLTRVSKED